MIIVMQWLAVHQQNAGYSAAGTKRVAFLPLAMKMEQNGSCLSTRNETGENMSAIKITIEATINAGIGKVWEYWNQPDHITKWNFAIDTWHCPKASNDLRVGGRLLSRMEAKDGSFGFDFEATYDEVIDKRRIVYTIADGRKVETGFHDLGNQTRIITVFEAEGENPAEMQRDGWQAILNNFKVYAEKT